MLARSLIYGYQWPNRNLDNVPLDFDKQDLVVC